jgi:hypothetical protein
MLVKGLPAGPHLAGYGDRQKATLKTRPAAMTNSDFVAYVGDADIHDGQVLSIDRHGSFPPQMICCSGQGALQCAAYGMDSH